MLHHQYALTVNKHVKINSSVVAYTCAKNAFKKKVAKEKNVVVVKETRQLRILIFLWNSTTLH